MLLAFNRCNSNNKNINLIFVIFKTFLNDLSLIELFFFFANGQEAMNTISPLAAILKKILTMDDIRCEQYFSPSGYKKKKKESKSNN